MTLRLKDNLKQLYYFYVVACEKSFSVAANRLYLTQPAVTMQVNNLEKNIKIKLIADKKNFLLTKKGKILMEYLEKVFSKLDELEQKLLEMDENRPEKLRIGITFAYSKTLLFEVLNKYRIKYPVVGIKIDIDSSENLFKKLQDGKLDIIIAGEVSRRINKKEMMVVMLGKEEICLVSAPEHPIQKKKSVTIADILNETIIMRDVRSATRKYIQNRFKKVKLPISVECENSDLIKKMVLAGKGISFLSISTVRNELDTGRLKRIRMKRNMKFFMDIKMMLYKEGYENPKVRHFVECVMSYIPMKKGDK